MCRLDESVGVFLPSLFLCFYEVTPILGFMSGRMLTIEYLPFKRKGKLEFCFSADKRSSRNKNLSEHLENPSLSAGPPSLLAAAGVSGGKSDASTSRDTCVTLTMRRLRRAEYQAEHKAPYYSVVEDVESAWLLSGNVPLIFYSSRHDCLKKKKFKTGLVIRCS